MRKFYRTILTIEILSEDKPYDGGITDLSYDITKGDWSGSIIDITTKRVESSEIAKLLQDQGSDPEFFGIDQNGKDINI